jgi:CubicO group peptidase (beta-lactamase class C family)
VALTLPVHLGDFATQSFGQPPIEVVVENGFPPLENSSIVFCDSYGDIYPQCTRAQFLQGIIDHPPVNPVWYTPTYSNLAYAILALAYESATGVPFDKAVDDLFVNKLGMTSTTSHVPQGDYDAVIPRNDSYALFTYDIGIQGPAGNQYTSTKDFRAWGHAIYTNKFLSAAETRKWLLPVTSTSRWTSSVGVCLPCKAR